MKKYYIIELGGEKEMDEMDALELAPTIDGAIDWIQGNMESDSEYYGININCTIHTNHDKDDNSLTNQYCDALVCVKYDSIVTNEMMASDIYSPEDIIISNLSVVSKIIKKLIEE